VAEWPVASVARTDVVDPALWEQAGRDPKLYTFLLRKSGKLSPLFEPASIPFFAKLPLAPLAATVMP
jgi:hypothetical protein